VTEAADPLSATNDRSDDGLLADQPLSYPVVRERLVLQGGAWAVRQDTVDLGAAGQVTREYLDHPGAVGVLALDGDDRVLLVRQYRHPVRSLMWELPAGLCDVAGEALEVTAARELWEETGYVSERLEPLLDTNLSPGSSSERLVIFLAPQVRLSSEMRHEASGEEIGMEVAWRPLDEVLDGILAGRLRNPSLALGVLALRERRRRGGAGPGVGADQLRVRSAPYA
jgi:8-oxo-dGDP phosphatase